MIKVLTFSKSSVRRVWTRIAHEWPAKTPFCHLWQPIDLLTASHPPPGVQLRPPHLEDTGQFSQVRKDRSWQRQKPLMSLAFIAVQLLLYILYLVHRITHPEQEVDSDLITAVDHIVSSHLKSAVISDVCRCLSAPSENVLRLWSKLFWTWEPDRLPHLWTPWITFSPEPLKGEKQIEFKHNLK